MKHADGIIRSEILRTATAFIQALALYEHDMFLKQSDFDFLFGRFLRNRFRFSYLILFSLLS